MHKPLLAALALLLAWPLAAAGAQQTLRIGSDISYAPLEFYAGKPKRIEGFDYDLAQALAARMGERAVFRDHDFSGLLPALDAGKFDLVISAMSDTRARMKRADFVDYFLAGSGILVDAGNPHHIFNLAGLCGMTVDLQRGSEQQSLVEAQSKRCTSIGLRPVKVLAFATDARALREFEAGKSVAHISDYPVAAYLAQTLGGGKHYVVAGRQFGVAPYGIAVAKTNPALLRRVQAALKAIVANGTYDALLQKWGLQQGAMRSAPIDAGTKFQ